MPGHLSSAVTVALRVALTVLIVVALLVALAWLGQRRLIYFPDRSLPSPPGTVRPVTLHTDDGLELTAWLVPPSGPDRRMAVLVCPGNAGHRGYRMPLADGLAARGFTVLLLDYRGYGGNPGRPSDDGLRRDALAAREFLRTEGFDTDRTIYFGESLGAAVAVDLAAQHPPAGLVLRSPFVDLAAVGAHHYPVLPVRALLRDRYPVADLIGRVDIPTTVIYGDADTVIPPEQSRTVFERAAAPVTLVAVPGADHNDPVLTDGAPVLDAVNDLARRISD